MMKLIYAAFAITLALGACSANPPEQTGSTSTAITSNGSSTSGNTTTIVLKNPSFTTDNAGVIADWSAKEHSEGKSFIFSLDRSEPYSAPASARIQRVGAEIYGILDQRVPALPDWSGKVARLSGVLRTAKVDSFGAGLILQVIGGGDSIMEWNHMNDRRVTGTTPWQRYVVEVNVPTNANYIRVGVMLEGGGTLWADDLKLEIVN